MKCVAVVVASGLVGAAAAQTLPTNTRLMFEFDRTTVSPHNASVTLTVSAAWDEAMPKDYAFGAVNYDLVAESGEFTGLELLLGMNPPNNAGVINGRRVVGAAIGQANFCGFSGCLYRFGNPMELASYTWETDDFSPRTVAFASENTTLFSLIPGHGGVSINLYPERFTPGFGSITVVPAPASGLVLCAGVLLTRGRRR